MEAPGESFVKVSQAIHDSIVTISHTVLRYTILAQINL
jgi:hypothetical protein